MTTEVAAGSFARYTLAYPVREPIIALGSDNAGRPCLAVEDYCLLAPAAGDIREVVNYRRFETHVSELAARCESPPRQVAHDLHPDHLSTAFARAMRGITMHAIQHQEAHAAAALTHFSIIGDVIGVVFDGIGWGTDGALWGGEILVGSASGFKRMAHLQYVAMPGGESAAGCPWKMAVSHVLAALGSLFDKADVPHFVYISDREIREITRQCAEPGISPRTSSVGGLFDAVAVLCGLFAVSGEILPARLEAMADPTVEDCYAIDVALSGDGHVIRTGGIIRAVVADVANQVPSSAVSARFHNTLAAAAAEVCGRLSHVHGIRTVVLSGEMFCNQLLVGRLKTLLERRGLETYAVPAPLAGDEGIAVGQAAIASERLALETSRRPGRHARRRRLT